MNDRNEVDPGKLRVAQVQQLYKQASPALYGAFITAAILVLVLWNVVEPVRLALWFGFTAGLYIARHKLVGAFLRRAPQGNEVLSWDKWFALTTAVSGILWGLVPLILFPENSPLHQAALVILIGGTCSGTVVVYCPRKSVYLPFTLLAGLPMAFAFFGQGDAVHSLMGVIVLVYVAVLIVTGNRMHAANEASIRLQFTNQNLLERLTQEKTATDALNLSLQKEVEERQKAEEQIRADLKEKEILLREVHHRVKNNLAAVSSLVGLQSHYAPDDIHRHLFEETQVRIRSLALAHEKLYQSENLANLHVAEYFSSLVEDILFTSSAEGRAITIRKEIEDVSIGLDTAIPLGFIVTELFSNCLKHAFPNGRSGEVRIALSSVADGEMELMVSDTGLGMPSDFMLETSKTLGLDLVRTFVRQLRGKLHINGTNGTQVLITFREKPKKKPVLPGGNQTVDGHGS